MYWLLAFTYRCMVWKSPTLITFKILGQGCSHGGKGGREATAHSQKNLKHKNSPPLINFRFLIPKNFKQKKVCLESLNIFLFLIRKNFKHKKVRLQCLKYFLIPNATEFQR